MNPYMVVASDMVPKMRYAVRTSLALDTIQRRLSEISRGLRVPHIEELSSEDAEDAYRLHQSIAVNTEQKGTTDLVSFTDVHDMSHFLRTSIKSFGINDPNSGKLLALGVTHPCHFCRSLVPQLCRHSVWVSRDVQGEGVGSMLIDVLHSVGIDAGYKGMLGKTSIENTVGRKTASRGTGLYRILTGVLPRSSYSVNFGWQDEVIFYTDFQSHASQRKSTSAQVSNTPPPSPTLDELPPMWFPKVNKRVHTIAKDTQIILDTATGSDVQVVNDMLLGCAERGEGFSPCEFYKDGTYGRKMFKKVAYLVAKRLNSDEIIGACALGPSIYYQSPQAKVFHTYVLINPKYRNKGYAMGMLQAVEDFAKQYKVCGLMFDPFNVDLPTIKLSRKHGFNVIGSIPKSGFFQRHGLVDSVLMYKPISKWGK